jgi:hypothetical protein
LLQCFEEHKKSMKHLSQTEQCSSQDSQCKLLFLDVANCFTHEEHIMVCGVSKTENMYITEGQRIHSPTCELVTEDHG